MKALLAWLFAGAPASEQPWTEKLCVYGVLLLLTLLAYGNSLQNEFVFDDQSVVVRNPLIRDLGSIPMIYTTPRWVGAEQHLYRPVTLTTFALNHAAGGLDPFGYHLANIALHALVVISVYALGTRLGLTSAANFVSAAIFAVHPIHTEAVTPVVGRAELLMSLGTLLSLIWYIDSWTQPGRKVRYVAASTAAFTLALLSKEQSMVLPVLLILYDLARPGSPARSIQATWKERLVRYVPYWTVLGGAFGVRHLLLGSTLYTAGREIAFLDNPLARLDWTSRLPGALTVAGRYLGLFLWPRHLSADYSYNAISLPASLWTAPPLAVLVATGALLYAALRSYRGGGRRAFFAIGFTLATFAPASNVLVPIGTILGERLFYLPSVGLCLLCAVAFEWLVIRLHAASNRNMGAAVATLLVLLLGLGIVRTLLRNRDWRNNDSLTLSGLAVVPGSAKLHAGLAAFHIKRNDFPAALRAYEEATRIYPDYPHQYPRFAGNLGSVLSRLGKPDEAIPHLETSVRLDPGNATTHYNLGYTYLSVHAWGEAAAQFRRALELEPDRTDARKGLAIAEARRKSASTVPPGVPPRDDR